MEVNVRREGGNSFFHPPAKWNAGTEKMGPPTVSEDLWTAEVTHLSGFCKWGSYAKECDLFDAMWDARPPPVLNKFNPTQTLKRSHGTWGFEYKYGTQNPFLGPLESAPELVMDCVDAVLEREGEYSGRVFAHANWYPDHTAGIGAHKDDEDGHISGAPVYSFTFYDPRKTTGDVKPYRYFVFSQNAQPPYGRQWPIPLSNGDILIMNGACQHPVNGVWHRVPPGRKAVCSRRINVTVRFGAD